MLKTIEIRKKPTTCSYDDDGMLVDLDESSDLENAPMIAHLSTSVVVSMTYGNPFESDDGL